MSGFIGAAGEMKRLLDGVKQFEKEGAKVTADATLVLVDALMARTPVWSGETVRNYAVGVGSAPSGAKSAIGGVEPGDTNNMPLGPEPRRARNEAAARAEAQAVINPEKLVNYVVTNTVASSKWDLVENGSAPTPDRARYPGGITALAQQSFRARFQGVFK
jgi:hypothetical protein